MPTLNIQLGTENHSSSESISGSAFGAEFLGVRIFQDEGNNFVPFVQEQIGYHHLRWPGDHVETETTAHDNHGNSVGKIQKYGFEFDDFVNPLYSRDDGQTREGLSDMFEFANDNNLSFAMVAPSVRYVEMELEDSGSGIAQAAIDLEHFLSKLSKGEFGTVPDSFTIELGSEYYGTTPWKIDNVEPLDLLKTFGKVFAAMSAKIAEFEEQSDIEINVAVQLGRMRNTDNEKLIEEFEKFDPSDIFDNDGAAIFLDPEQSALDGVDSVIWHRYVTRFDGINNGLWDPIKVTDDSGVVFEQTVESLLGAWELATDRSLSLVAGFSAPSLNGAGDDNNGFGPLKPEHLEESLTYLLEITTGLLAVGMDIGSLYGVGSGSFGSYAFQDEVFLGGELWALMAESLPGTHVVEGYQDNESPFSREYDDAGNLVELNPVVTDKVNSYVFESEEKIVVFLVAKDFEGKSLDYTLTFDSDDFGFGMTSVYPQIEATHLWAGDDFTDSSGNTIAVYGETIVDTVEAKTTENGFQTSVTFQNDYEAIRLVIMKNDPQEGESGEFQLSDNCGILVPNGASDVFEFVMNDDQVLSDRFVREPDNFTFVASNQDLHSATLEEIGYLDQQMSPFSIQLEYDL